MSDRFVIRDASIPGPKILERLMIGDQRGFLERLFSAGDLSPLIGDRAIVEINRTVTSRRGTVRGMHFQSPPHAEIKFVSCLRGSAFDVAIDGRPESPTYLRWHAETLDGRDHRTMLIPEGFAHGFQALTDDCELLYFHTAAYAPSAENGFNPRDPRLSITWPQPIVDMSPRDEAFPMLGTGGAGS